VETYNNLIFQKLSISNEIFDVVPDINAFEFKHIHKGLKIPILNYNFFWNWNFGFHN
jgi:hypothetical protein